MKIKKGDKVTLKIMPIVFGKVIGRKGKIIYVIWEGITEPGKIGKVPEKDLIRIP